MNKNVAGVKNGNECFCGKKLPPTKYLAASPRECNVPCSGNQNVTCGGIKTAEIFKFRN